MEVISHRKPIVDYILIIFGTTLLAFAINVFFEPLEMITGGITGIAIIVKQKTQDLVVGGIPLWLTNLVINIPLFITALIIKGKDFGVRTLFATIYLSFALFYTQWLPEVTSDFMLGSVFGGVIAGVGLGMVFSAFATTGGSDLGATIIQHFHKHISVANILLALDGLVICLGFFVFGAEKSMYAIVSVYITAKVIDAILEGLKFAKAAFIISNKEEIIAKTLLSRLDRGITGLHGQGMYTKASREVLLCVVSKKEIVTLKEIVKECDHNAFVIVADVREVLGEGFIEQKKI